MKKSIRLTVIGSIQPVFFNKFIKENAESLGLRGFTRKLEDNSVEVFVEGDVDSIDKMIPIVKRGPRHSMIRSVTQKDETFQDFKDFRVLNI